MFIRTLSNLTFKEEQFKIITGVQIMFVQNVKFCSFSYFNRIINFYTIDKIEKQNKIAKAFNLQQYDVWLQGIKGVWKVFCSKLGFIVLHPIFEQIIMVSVVINTAILALDGMFTKDHQKKVMEGFNDAFTIIFIIEMVLKLIAFGIKQYVTDPLNMFDGLIVITSIIDMMFMSGNNKAFTAFRTVRIFRTFRVLRVTKLLRSLSFMKVIIGVVSRALSSFLNVALLLFLFLFIYSLLGWQIFNGELSYQNEIEMRSNFDTFSRSFITVFQILTMENWQQIFYVTLSSNVNQVINFSILFIITIIYFISWIFIGNLSLLNLFLAILLDGFTNEDAQADAKEVEKQLDRIDHEEDVSETASITTTNIFGQDQSSLRLSQVNLKKEEKKEGKEIKKLLHKNFEVASQQNIESDIEDIEKQIEEEDKIKEDQKREQQYQQLTCQISLFIFKKSNCFRRISYQLIQHPNFDKIILLLIILSSLKLAIDTYIQNDDQNNLKRISMITDMIINIIFLIEALLKIVSFGFIFGEDTYIRDSWNKIDFIIVVTSMLDMSVEDINIPALKILRMLRTLRPLRFVSHNVNIKIVVIALFQSMGAIFNVLIVVFLVYLMFGILGMSLLSGKMSYCKVENYYGISKETCKHIKSKWQNIDTNFDNIGSSLVTLFVMGSLEGWPDIMYAAIDSTDIDKGPEKNNNLEISLFFIAFILVGSFFFLNLFTGAICFNFDQAHKNEKSCMYAYLTEGQRNWIEMQKMILRAKPDFSRFYIPENKTRLKVFTFINSKSFEIGIMVCILLNIITMALSYEGMSLTLENALEVTNYIFTAVFIIECLLKLFALGWNGYWIVSWNKFDFIVVLSSIVDIILSILLTNNSSSFLRIGPQLARVVRVMRVSRLLKLSKNLEGLQKILETMVLSFPSMMNIGALTLVVLYIYGVLGCYLFQEVTEGNKVDQNSNFLTFHNSIITLFRCVTGEDWFVIMYDVSKTSDCIEGKTCGSAFAIPFFLTFILIGRFIMMNLFILVILNDFEEYHLKTDNPVEKFQNNLESFMSIWEKYTQHAHGQRIKENKIVNFFEELHPPLGFHGQKKTKQQIATELFKLNIPNIENYIYFNDLLFAAMKRVYGEKMAQQTSKELITYIALEEKETKKRLGELKKKELVGKKYEKMNDREFQNLVRHTNPVVQGIFVRMTFLIWKRYGRLIDELKNEEYEGLDEFDIRDKVSIATAYDNIETDSIQNDSGDEQYSDNSKESDNQSKSSKGEKRERSKEQNYDKQMDKQDIKIENIKQNNRIIQQQGEAIQSNKSNQQNVFDNMPALQIITPKSGLLSPGHGKNIQNPQSHVNSTRLLIQSAEKKHNLKKLIFEEIDINSSKIDNSFNDQSNIADNSQIQFKQGLSFNNSHQEDINLHNNDVDISPAIPIKKKIIDFEDLDVDQGYDFSPAKSRINRNFQDSRSKMPSTQVILQNHESSNDL